MSVWNYGAFIWIFKMCIGCESASAGVRKCCWIFSSRLIHVDHFRLHCIVCYAQWQNYGSYQIWFAAATAASTTVLLLTMKIYCSVNTMFFFKMMWAIWNVLRFFSFLFLLLRSFHSFDVFAWCECINFILIRVWESPRNFNLTHFKHLSYFPVDVCESLTANGMNEWMNEFERNSSRKPAVASIRQEIMGKNSN